MNTRLRIILQIKLAGEKVWMPLFIICYHMPDNAALFNVLWLTIFNFKDTEIAIKILKPYIIEWKSIKQILNKRINQVACKKYQTICDNLQYKLRPPVTHLHHFLAWFKYSNLKRFLIVLVAPKNIHLPPPYIQIVKIEQPLIKTVPICLAAKIFICG